MVDLDTVGPMSPALEFGDAIGLGATSQARTGAGCLQGNFFRKAAEGYFPLGGDSGGKSGGRGRNAGMVDHVGAGLAFRPHINQVLAGIANVATAIGRVRAKGQLSYSAPYTWTTSRRAFSRVSWGGGPNRGLSRPRFVCRSPGQNRRRG